VSFTAGVCEELLFRGWLLWYFAEFAPYPVAIALSLASFGLGHAYQGVRGIVLTTLLGAVLLAIYLVAGTIWPAMLFHAAFDAANGLLGYAVARSALLPPAPPAA
jgi:membrane protease YdiL (CAAX protease family)